MNKKDEEIEAEIVEEKGIILAPFTDLDLVGGVDLQELLKTYAKVPKIDPEAENAGEQYQYVLKGHKAFVTARNKIEKVRKALKAPALEFGKDVDRRAKDLAFSIIDKELELFKQRKLVEDNEQRKQDEAETIERERTGGIRSLMEAMQGLPFAGIGAKANTLKELIESMEIPEECVYAEFTEEATGYYKTVMTQLEMLYETATKAEQTEDVQREVEAKRVEAEAKAEAEHQAEKEALRLEREEFEREKKELEDERVAVQEAKNLEQAEREAEEIEKAEIEQSKKDVEEALEMVSEAKRVTTDEFFKAYDKDGLNSVLEELFGNKFTHVKWEV